MVRSAKRAKKPCQKWELPGGLNATKHKNFYGNSPDLYSLKICFYSFDYVDTFDWHLFLNENYDFYLFITVLSYIYIQCTREEVKVYLNDSRLVCKIYNALYTHVTLVKTERHVLFICSTEKINYSRCYLHT